MSLLILPDEILLKVFKDPSVSFEDLISLSITCHRLQNICNSKDIWKSKYTYRWPWIWKKICDKEALVSVWKEEVFAVLKVQRIFHERLGEFSHELYKHTNLTVPVVNSVKELFCIGKFGPLYVLNELRDFLRDKSHPKDNIKSEQSAPNLRIRSLNPSMIFRPNWIRVMPSQSHNLIRHKNLTKKYYGQLALEYVHKVVCEEEWLEFFSLPQSNQTLEKGAFLFAKWFQANEFLDIELVDVTSKLNGLARDVLSYLKSQCPNHPAVSHCLIHPDNPLEETLWSSKDSEKLFDCINHVLFIVNKFKGNENYYLRDNSFINKVLEAKKGIPVTLSIIYYSICHRLGIVLYPVNCPSHFMLKWKIPNTNRVEYVDAFHKGSRKNATSLSFESHPNVTHTRNLSCNTIKVLERMTNNTLHVAQRNLESYDRFTEMLLAAEISVIFDPNNEELLDFLYSLYLSVELHIDRVILGCNRLFAMNPQTSRGFERLKEEAEAILENEMKGPTPVKRQERGETDGVHFATGMIMNHKLYGYNCVISGWDTVCKMPMDWIIQMNVLALKYQNYQPFYNVLVEDGSIRYAAQENLLFTDPVVIPNREVGRFFKEFNGNYYVPNDELNFEYPNEDNVRKDYYPHLDTLCIQN